MTFIQNFRFQIILACILAGLLSMMIMVILIASQGWGPDFSTGQQGILLLVAMLCGALTGRGVGIWIGRHLKHTIETSEAWLSGNFKPRIVVRTHDELAQIQEHMNQMADQLEHEEQDFHTLRQHDYAQNNPIIFEERSRLAHRLNDGVRKQIVDLANIANAIATQQQVGVTQQTGAYSDNLFEKIQQMEIMAKCAEQEISRLIDELSPGSLADPS